MKMTVVQFRGGHSDIRDKEKVVEVLLSTLIECRRIFILPNNNNDYNNKKSLRQHNKKARGIKIRQVK